MIIITITSHHQSSSIIINHHQSSPSIIITIIIIICISPSTINILILLILITLRPRSFIYLRPSLCFFFQPHTTLHGRVEYSSAPPTLQKLHWPPGDDRPAPEMVVAKSPSTPNWWNMIVYSIVFSSKRFEFRTLMFLTIYTYTDLHPKVKKERHGKGW